MTDHDLNRAWERSRAKQVRALEKLEDDLHRGDLITVTRFELFVLWPGIVLALAVLLVQLWGS